MCNFLTLLQGWLVRLSVVWRPGSRCWRWQISTLEVSPTEKVDCEQKMVVSQFSAISGFYQVLPKTVQPRILDFSSLLDYHEGKDTDQSCNLKHLVWKSLTVKAFYLKAISHYVGVSQRLSVQPVHEKVIKGRPETELHSTAFSFSAWNRSPQTWPGGGGASQTFAWRKCPAKKKWNG